MGQIFVSPMSEWQGIIIREPTIISVARFAVGGGQAAIMRQLEQLPPDVIEQLRDLGIRPGAFASPGWAIGGSAVCCGLGLLLAAALGAAGGAIMVSLKRE